MTTEIDHLVMPRNQLHLKTRLKLKKLQRMIEDEVECNFGYAPDTTAFDQLIDERTQWESIAKRNFPDIYSAHDRHAYCTA